MDKVKFCDYKLLSFSWIAAPLNSVVESIQDLMSKHWIVKVDQSSIELEKIYTKQPSGSEEEMRILLWEPFNMKDSTIFFSNVIDGWQSLVYGIHRKSKRNTLRVIFPMNEDVNEYVCDFEYYAENIHRRIAVMEDFGRFEFFSSGSILPFEKSEYYNKRRYKDRFNKKIVLEYLESLNVKIYDDNFYKTCDCVFINFILK